MTILSEKFLTKKQTEIDLDAILERLHNKNLNIVGPLSKLRMTIEEARQAKQARLIYFDASDSGLASICKDNYRLRRNYKFYVERARSNKIFFWVNKKVVEKQTPKMAYRQLRV